MRWFGRIVLSLAVVVWVTALRPAMAQQQAAPAQAQAAKTQARTAKPPYDPDGTKMEALLVRWAAKSQELQSLKVRLKLTEKKERWGEESMEGIALFRRPNLAFLEFYKRKQDANKAAKLVQHERIVCTGKEVWQYSFGTSQVFVHTLDPEQRTRALQEGPLPFLFNFEVEMARKRYIMKLYAETEKSYIITILPLLSIDKESFSSAWVELNKQLLLPTRIVLLNPEGKDKKDYEITEIKPDEQIPVVNFECKPPGSPWKVMYNQEQAAAAKPGSAPAGAPAATANNAAAARRTQQTAPAQQPPRTGAATENPGRRSLFNRGVR